MRDLLKRLKTLENVMSRLARQLTDESEVLGVYMTRYTGTEVHLTREGMEHALQAFPEAKPEYMHLGELSGNEDLRWHLLVDGVKLFAIVSEEGDEYA